MKFDIQHRGRLVHLDISAQDSVYRLEHGGKVVEFHCVRVSDDTLSVMVGDRVFTAYVHSAPPGYSVQIHDLAFEFEVLEGGGGIMGERGRRGHGGAHRLSVPMPGKVVSVLKKVGDAVSVGEGIVVVEAMKMQNEIRSPRAGKVREIRVVAGETIEGGATVAVIE
ncbi:MAG: acetyl-CoA carboxylase biotin carboxyl carrier protein subunit [Acidobacteriota bacterium]